MTVGFFMPLPLAVMIPFMAGQSFAMGEAFGKGFQFGKRKISSMTNEEFNAMSASDHFTETTADISAMIPSMKSQMNNFSMLQTDIIKTLIEQLKDAGIQISETVIEAAQDTFEEGPPGGTLLAQQTLDTLRGYVGMPPIYSKLVDPTGLNALLNYWNAIGILPSLSSNTDIWAEIKKIFDLTPPPSTVTDVANWIIANTDNSGFIGPPAPDDSPTDTEQSLIDVGIEPDIREDEGGTREEQIAFFSSLPSAPTSIRTEWNKRVQELIAIAGILSSTSDPALLDKYQKLEITVKNVMRELKRTWNFGDNINMGFSTMIST